MRPYILMRIESSYVDINDPSGKSTFQKQPRIQKSEKMIEKEVFQRLATHYKGAQTQHMNNADAADNIDEEEFLQNPDEHPRPILRVIIRNTEKKYISLKPLESKLEGLIANPG